MLLGTHIRRSGSGNNIHSNKSTEVGHTNTLFLKRLFAGYPLANKNIFAGAPPANKTETSVIPHELKRHKPASRNLVRQRGSESHKHPTPHSTMV